LRAAVALLLTIAVLWLLVRRFGGGSDFAAVLRGVRLPWVAAALAAAGGCVVLGALRWRLLLGVMGHDLPLVRALEVVLATWPLAMVTPSRANDLLRPLAVRARIPLSAGTGSVLAEKAIDLLVLLVLAAAGAAIRDLVGWAMAIGALAVAEVATIGVVMTRRAWLVRLPVLRARLDAVEALFLAFRALGRAPSRLVAPAMASLGIRFLTIGISHAMLLAAGARVSLFDTLTLWPAATLAGLAPITLAGVGVRDAAFIHLLAERGAHADPTQVLAATVGYSAVAIGFFSVVGLPFMVRELFRKESG
jgi:glycosyltransferase 2 family protein